MIYLFLVLSKYENNDAKLNLNWWVIKLNYLKTKKLKVLGMLKRKSDTAWCKLNFNLREQYISFPSLFELLAYFLKNIENNKNISYNICDE